MHVMNGRASEYVVVLKHVRGCRQAGLPSVTEVTETPLVSQYQQGPVAALTEVHNASNQVYVRQGTEERASWRKELR